MANFEIIEDEEYDKLFLTQEWNNSGIVSLEESDEFRSVLDPKYSDISEDDDEEEAMFEHMRWWCIFLVHIVVK